MNELRAKITVVIFLLTTLVVLTTTEVSAQSAKEMRDIFTQAENYLLYEDYELANQLYILLDSPDNLNIKYKIGSCYLNIPGEKEKAIPYLEEAVKNASFDAKPESFTEKRAPLDAYFLLGKAYMINNELEKALNTLQTFNNLARDTKIKEEMKNLEFIDQQIQACRNAIKFAENPETINKKMLGGGFAQGAMNENPAVSFDGNSMVYTERRGMVNIIMYSRKERDVWQTPIDITLTINAGEDCSTCSMNKDGSVMFLYKNDNYDGNIYMSKLENGNWSKIKKLNKNINTKFYESHASVSADGRKLYFTSNRDGGSGSLDIYVSELDASGDWGPAVNLGNTVNTPYNEDTPFITANDSVLYFCSEGHFTMGGYDIFKSQWLGTGWKTPTNLGIPINSTDDDKFFQPLNNGVNAYYSMTTDYKKKDIFLLGFQESASLQVYEISGTYSLSDTSVFFDKKNNISLLNQMTGDTIDIGYPNKYTGRYNFMVNPGKFRILYAGTGYISKSVDTTIVQDNPVSTILIDAVLEPDPNYIPTVAPQVVYDKIDLASIPVVEQIDSTILIKDVKVSNVDDANVNDADILYYTVQIMALYKPVDISFFKYINDMKVMYSESDRFYRYTSGKFNTREEAITYRQELIRKGYPKEIFIKKVSK